MSKPVQKPKTPKELADLLDGRSERWVQREIREKRIRICPIHGRPRLVPADECNRLLGLILTCHDHE